MVPVEIITAFEANGQQLPPPAEIVSVAISLFNYHAFLQECLNSVMDQTYAYIELIVVDDCSTDCSVEVARDWMIRNHERFVRTTLIRHVKNQGLSQARNTAFEVAKGDQVFVLDADNILYPRAVARLHDTLARTMAGVSYSQLEFFGDESRLGFADVWDRNRFKRGNYIDAMALVSRQAWRDVGGYTNMDLGWEDYDFWCKFVEHGIVGMFVPEILCRYRVHGNSMLRKDTNPKISRSVQLMNIVHPWLDLDG